MNYFSSNLKYLRGLNKFSQNKLADILGVNHSTISRWETGEMGATLENAYDLSLLFKVPIADLVEKDLRLENLEIEEDFIIMPKDYKKYKKGDKVPVNEVLEYVDEMQNKIDKIRDNLGI